MLIRPDLEPTEARLARLCLPGDERAELADRLAQRGDLRHDPGGGRDCGGGAPHCGIRPSMLSSLPSPIAHPNRPQPFQGVI